MIAESEEADGRIQLQLTLAESSLEAAEKIIRHSNHDARLVVFAGADENHHA